MLVNIAGHKVTFKDREELNEYLAKNPEFFDRFYIISD